MTDEGQGANGAISVSRALFLAKGALESITVRILGEVSELSNKPGYKAVYFSIKDDSATLPCMMWMNRFNAAGVDIRVGSLVEVSGRFSLYAAKGRMNFDVFSLTLAGEGNLRLKVANLAKKLQAQGLMEPARKLPIPPYPERIGLVTSPRGAAVHDVLRTLRRRFPLAKVFLAGVPVEGPDAARNIKAGLEALEAQDLDVILLVRGGGSFEDLMPFNDEQLAYAIAEAKTPIVTGIGHEPDNSIADMVSDLRASTPTAAAESISVALGETMRSLRSIVSRLRSGEERRIEDARRRVDLIGARSMFAEPMRLFADEAQAIDDLAARLATGLPVHIERLGDKLEADGTAFRKAGKHTFEPERNLLSRIAPRMMRTGRTLLDGYATQVRLAASRIEDLSPLTVLARGYSIAQDRCGKVVASIDGVEVGDELKVVLDDGSLRCSVQGKDEEKMAIEAFDA